MKTFKEWLKVRGMDPLSGYYYNTEISKYLEYAFDHQRTSVMRSNGYANSYKEGCKDGYNRGRDDAISPSFIRGPIVYPDGVYGRVKALEHKIKNLRKAHTSAYDDGYAACTRVEVTRRNESNHISYNQGYQAGLSQVKRDAKQTEEFEYDRGYKGGYDEGKKRGHKRGHKTGFDTGKTQASTTSYYRGYRAGRDSLTTYMPEDEYHKWVQEVGQAARECAMTWLGGETVAAKAILKLRKELGIKDNDVRAYKGLPPLCGGVTYND